VEGLAWDRTPAPPLGALLARIKGPGRRYTGVCVELTTGSPLSSGVSRCRRSHPATVICITVVVLGPHGQSVRVKVSIIMYVGVQSFYLNILMLCRLCLLYTGLYAISARYTYCCALPFFRVEGLFRRRSGGAILLPCRQRHLGHPRWRRAAPCRSTRVGEGLAWDRAPAPSATVGSPCVHR
jgi:hypothetical protein